MLRDSVCQQPVLGWELPLSLLLFFFLPVLKWTYLTTFVFLDVLDCVSVLAPWAQVVHDINDPGI